MNDDAPFKTDINIAGHNGDVQLYGIIDIGGAYVNHSLPSNSQQPNNIYPYSIDAGTMGVQAPSATGNKNYANGSQTTWMNGGLQDSRLGLKGGIDLFSAADNKFRMIYALEIGFNPLNGTLNDAAKVHQQNDASNSGSGYKKTNTIFGDSSLNGELFGRQAWAGIDGGYLGKVSYGIQYNPFYEITGAYDPNNKADTFSPIGESGAVGGGGGISENSRMKNSIKYANSVPFMDGKVNATAMYQFGNAIDTSYGRGYALAAGYENSLLGFQVAYNNFTDAPKADTSSTANSIVLGLYNTSAWLGTFKVTPTKDITLKAGYEWYELKTPSDNTLSYGSAWGTPVSSTGCSNNSSKGPACSGYQDTNFIWAGGEYDFGQRFPVLDGLKLSAGYYDTVYGGVEGGTTGLAFHVHTETTVLTYKLNKRFDIYGAATWNQFGGTYVDAKKAAGVEINDVNAYGVGIRMKF